MSAMSEVTAMARPGSWVRVQVVRPAVVAAIHHQGVLCGGWGASGLVGVCWVMGGASRVAGPIPNTPWLN